MRVEAWNVSLPIFFQGLYWNRHNVEELQYLKREKVSHLMLLPFPTHVSSKTKLLQSIPSKILASLVWRSFMPSTYATDSQMNQTSKTHISLAFPSLHCRIKVSFCAISPFCPQKTVSPSTPHILHDLKLPSQPITLHPWFCSLILSPSPPLETSFLQICPHSASPGDGFSHKIWRPLVYSVFTQKHPFLLQEHKTCFTNADPQIPQFIF